MTTSYFRQIIATLKNQNIKGSMIHIEPRCLLSKIDYTIVVILVASLVWRNNSLE